MTGLAEQYAWFADFVGSDSYCLTLVKDRSQIEVIRILGADGERMVPNFEAVWRETQEIEDPASVVAASALGNHVLLFEPYGWRGVTREVAESLSRETVLVSHAHTLNGDSAFMWAEGGITQAEFELQSAWNATGVRAGQLERSITEAGFPDLENDLSGISDVYLPAAMALMEMITGVRVSRESLDSSQYLCARVPE